MALETAPTMSDMIDSGKRFLVKADPHENPIGWAQANALLAIAEALIEINTALDAVIDFESQAVRVAT